MSELSQLLTEARKVSFETQRVFFAGMNFSQIRKRLEEMGLNPHMPIELFSTEVVLLTPEGVMMNVRKNLDQEGKITLGLWGGVMKFGETPEEAATRAIREETGLDIRVMENEYMMLHIHEHTYANGDKAIFWAYRYVIILDYVPEIQPGKLGARLVKTAKDLDKVLSHQREFVSNLLK